MMEKGGRLKTGRKLFWRHIRIKERAFTVIALTTLIAAVAGLIAYAWILTDEQAPAETGPAYAAGPYGSSGSEPLGLPSYGVTEQHALKTAVSFCGAELVPVGKSYDGLACYEFAGEGVRVSVTMQGGGVKSCETDSDYRVCDRSDAELAETAKEFLSAAGYGDTVPGTIVREGGRACLYMLPVHESGALLYTDVIRMHINMETLDVTGFYAEAYIMNHRYRELEPELSSMEALKCIPTSYVIEKPVLALIGGGEERLCYRYKCVKQGEELVFFVNAQTGVMEDIYVQNAAV